MLPLENPNFVCHIRSAHDSLVDVCGNQRRHEGTEAITTGTSTILNMYNPPIASQIGHIFQGILGLVDHNS